ncbi:chemotaxis protein CheB [Thiocapsa sp.]|uniref:chemotaxis protein CheB n=1 Tax=Thiocapsa sp. TaxID=2024551 RepID=UPI001BCEE75D
MPADTDPDMAFVLVQHLAPDHKSILSDLYPPLYPDAVSEVEDGCWCGPTAPTSSRPIATWLFQRRCTFLEPVCPARSAPADRFFFARSPMTSTRAIGTVLGTGSDGGTLACGRSRARGGMVMAQSPESTEYDGMPRERHRHRTGGLTSCRRPRCPPS